MRKRVTTPPVGHLGTVQFDENGRTFTCIAASSPATPGTNWWWVSISDEKQRYGAFRTSDDDTESGLRHRVLAYYAQLIADRERAPIFKPHWAQRRAVAKPAEAPVAEAVAEIEAAATAGD
jgi:hypothetical protein